MKNINCFVLTFLISAFTIALAVMMYTSPFSSIVLAQSGSFQILEVVILIKYIAALIVSIPERGSLKQACYGFLTIDILAMIFIKNPGFPAGLPFFILLIQLAIIVVYFETERRQKIKHIKIMEDAPAKLASGWNSNEIILPDSIRMNQTKAGRITA
jgi:hypothetical protein